jgi:hypothetical protein
MKMKSNETKRYGVSLELFLLRDESVCVAMYDNMAAVRYGHW